MFKQENFSGKNTGTGPDPRLRYYYPFELSQNYIQSDPDYTMHFETPLNTEVIENMDKIYNVKVNEITKLLADCIGVSIAKIGSYGVEGLLFKAELDILISVPGASDFERAVGLMSSIAEPKHKDIWMPDRALLHSTSSYVRKYKNRSNDDESTVVEVPIDFVVTVADSPIDIHYKKTRRLLETNKKIRWEYNNLKAAHQGTKYSEYSKPKRVFWAERQPYIDAVEL